MRELADAKAADSLAKAHSRGDASSTIPYKLVQRSVSDTLVRMTCDKDAES